MKIVTVVGARPQFIKAAAVSRKLRIIHQEILVHTGQHYDDNMSEIFFKELHIPEPQINLRAGSGSHAKQTAQIMIGMEEVLLSEKPDCILVYGDTNSTLAGALAASKIHIPIVHVEAGLRSYNMEMPEEINRVLTDRISKLLLCPTITAVKNLEKEGITRGVHNIGDVMCDAVLYYSDLLSQTDKEHHLSQKRKELGLPEDLSEWYLATIHRAENTESQVTMEAIMNGLNQLDKPVVFPVHPRTRHWVEELCRINRYDNLLIINPLGYLDMLFFLKNSIKMITDSGGIQKEAYIMGIPCITIREQTEWVETLIGNHNVLVSPDTEQIVDKVFHTTIDYDKKENYYGNGDASCNLCNYIGEVLE